MSKGKRIYLGILILSIVLISVFYFSYAIFTSQTETHGKLNIVAGTLDYKLESKDLKNNEVVVAANSIKIINIKITSLNTIPSNYELYYNNNDNVEVSYLSSGDNVKGEIAVDGTKEIMLYIKNNSNIDQTVTFGVQGGLKNNELVLSKGHEIEENIKLYTENLLNGADPVISGDLIPVNISANGTVTKANIDEEWYNYGNKNWANAVITFSENNYEDGQTILESDIKQYYVWVPRYRYKLWNVGSGTLASDTNYPNGTSSESAIDIVFESKDTQPSTGSNNGEWLTHPAFTNFDTNGIWVGKFETSYNENSFTNSSVFLTSNPNTSAATSASNIIIKPNVRSLTNKDVSTFYTFGREVNENLNSHMMTNMEWGAVTYLTYSLYGKCTETGCEEVYLNNVNTGYAPSSSASYSGQWQYSADITGCSASSALDTIVGNKNSCIVNYAWNGSSNKASTTGNISGIYDMSGGNWEYVMAIIEDASSNLISGRNNSQNSGFNGIYGYPKSDGQNITSKTGGIDFPTDTRYYNLYTPYSYTAGDATWWVYTNGQLGDATKEIANTKTSSSSGDIGLWYSDYAYFLSPAYPWFKRGGDFHDSTGVGVMNFSRIFGNANSSGGFRVTLAY